MIFNKLQKSLFLVVIVFMTTVGVFAQNEISSPYSRFGLGSMNTNKSNTALQGMGGIANAMDGKHMLNNSNPAAYAEIDSLTFLLDAGFYMRYSTFRTANQTEKGSDASFDYFDLGFGITKWWKTGLGLTPFSSRDYISTASYTWEQPYPYSIDYEGYGGLNKVYWANGFKIYKGLALGVRMNYLFGNVTDETTLYFPHNNDFLNERHTDRLRISELTFTLGLMYKYDFKNDYQLSLGFTYGIPTTWKGHRDIFIRTMFKGYGTNNENPVDTIAYSTMQRVNINYPQSFGSGITLKKGDRWLVGIDFNWGNWEAFSMNGVTDSLQNCWNIAIGGCYTPEYTSVSNYMKKVTYRAGFHYDQTIFNIYGQSINKYGFTFGFGLPVLRAMTMLNFAFEFGKMGTTQSNLIEDSYFNISFGVSIHDRWFVKRRYK